MAATGKDDIIAAELAVEVATAWLSNPNTTAGATETSALLKAIYGAISANPDAGREAYTPAVTVRKSLASKEHIVSMIDGKPYRALRRHLSANGLTPDEYRSRYNLPASYPMVAESYSESRRAMARKMGLGNRSRTGSRQATATPETPKAQSQTAKQAGKDSTGAPRQPRKLPAAI